MDFWKLNLPGVQWWSPTVIRLDVACCKLATGMCPGSIPGPATMREFLLTEEELQEFLRRDKARWEAMGVVRNEFFEFYKKFGEVHVGIGRVDGVDFLNVTFFVRFVEKEEVPTEYNGIPVEVRFHTPISTVEP